jgi:hypothetical protein
MTFGDGILINSELRQILAREYPEELQRVCPYLPQNPINTRSIDPQLSRNLSRTPPREDQFHIQRAIV